ncbi:hypothetical protein DPEC_G00087810 [Dallia pectoralis]|uniref:Uncharacterized protein n=1 Tax=Dallia pectoralis TaxID=75939 RepID=A0ACC2H051_DALPE|nr:hypothetical protein DPEC_G00087810 [Dallia pectoralis]
MSRKSGKKDKKKSRNEDEYSESEEISDIVAAMEDGLVEGDAEVATPGENNRDILKAIISLKSGLYKKIDGVQTTITEVRKEIQECTGRLAHAEKRISDAEDNVNGLISKVSTLESTVKTLSDKVEDLECRSRRNNVRLVGLPEKAEGLDMVTFLEKWLPEALGMESRETLVIERAHRIGTLSNNDPRSARPRTLIMKFLNFKDKKRVLKAARIKRNVLYNNEQVRLHPDLSAGVHKMQRDYDDVQKKLRDKGIHKHRIIFPARLLLTHGDRSYTFQTPPEVVHFVRSL